MSAASLLKNWKKRNPQIKNIVLFISDALRWDYTPKSVLSRGVAFKTVSSCIWTPASFSSIVTGLYPQHHGVYSFCEDRLAEKVSSLLNLYGYNTSLWTENTWIGYDQPTSSPLYRLLRAKYRVSLKDLQPPFVYLEDEKGGHCPYGWSATDKDYEEWDCLRFFQDFGKRNEKMLRKKYQEGVERSAREFESRMRIIDDRGLADETLVIFLSDHGELLGEYGGVVGHGELTAPEVVYVPTVLIHPDLPGGKSFEKEGVLRHVDLYPTLCDLLSRRVETRVDGVSLLTIEKLPDLGFTYFIEKGKALSHELKEVSVWDKDGGYLFRRGASLPLLILRAFHLTMLSNSSLTAVYQRQRMRKFPSTLKNYGKLLTHFCRVSTKYGSPNFSLKQAKIFINRIYRQQIKMTEKEKIKIIVNWLKKEGKI